MKAFLIACLFLLLSGIALAQEKIADFGNIDPSELKLQECPFEKGAAAMNLLKTAKISMEVNGFSGVPTLITEYRIRIKIFNKQGFSAANVKIPYFNEGRSTRIKDIEAYIYSLDKDGSVTREQVEKKEIFNDKSRSASSANYTSFTFPDLHEGAVLEYRYTRVTRNSASIQPWFFQDEIPTAFSQVITNIPSYAYLTYRVIASADMKKDSSYKKHKNSSDNEEIVSFTRRNIHSFRPEPLMFSLSDNVERVEFSLSPRSYLHSSFLSNDAKMEMQNLGLLLSQSFGYQCNAPIGGTEHLVDSVKRLFRKEDRIAALYQYIQKNVEFNGEQTFYCDDVQGCWKARSGSSAEMNILLLNLLLKSGIKCVPLLVSTHDNGNPDRDFPTISQFNGVDVLVKDSLLYYVVDCTQKRLSYRMPPYNVLNSNAYIVDAFLHGWIFIVDSRFLLKTEATIDAEMDSAGNLKGTARIWDMGFAKTANLEALEKKESKSAEDESAENDNIPGLVIDTVAIELNNAIGDTLVRTIRFRFQPASSGNFYFVNPYLFFGFKKNPFKDSARYSDIDFGCNQSIRIRMRIQLAGNVLAEGLPGSISIQKQDSTISFKRNVFMEGNYLIIENSFLLRNAIFIKEDYASVRSFFDRFYTIINEDIALKKIK
jgi:hypothetical protein